MDHYLFFLTKEEEKVAKNCGWSFIIANEDRLIKDYQEPLLENVVDPSYVKDTQRIVYEQQVYVIFKDYADLANNRRIFLCRPSHDGCDQIDIKS